MSNSEILAGGDTNARLDTGMKVFEAVTRTAWWWEKTGRALMLKEGSATERAFASADPDDENFIPSGIINGLPWPALSKREKHRLVKFWHHFNVRNPDLIGTPEHEYKFGQGDKIE